MKVQQMAWDPSIGWPEPDVSIAAELVLVFGDRALLEERSALVALSERYPEAAIVGCSTAGEILDTTVSDGRIVATVVGFDHTRVETGSLSVDAADGSTALGRALGATLSSEGLRYVMVISDGLSVNGSELVAGLTESLPNGTLITGGLSGDAAAFEKTVVVMGDAVETRMVSVVGFYGDQLRVGHGCLGGWDPFGPERVVTRSEGNVLYELDGKSALSIYKRYLGPHADDLPSSALLFPLSVRTKGNEDSVVRTVLSVSDADESMTFAGDIPAGSVARFMKANFDRLIDGAHNAARASYDGIEGADVELALLISCVGRKLVLDQRIEEEVEGVRDVLGDGTALAGFYSYGEISPLASTGSCALHNQTMTITTMTEV